jgi:hypothetical protein
MLRTHAKYSPIAPDLVAVFEGDRATQQAQGKQREQAGMY